MKDNVDIIVDKIKNSRKCGIIINTLDNKQVDEMKKEIEKRLNFSSICCYSLKRDEVLKYGRYPLNIVESLFQSAETNFLFDKTIIFLDGIQKLANKDVNIKKYDSMSKLMNFEDKNSFLNLVDNLKANTNVFLIMQSDIDEENLSDEFLVRFDFLKETKTLDELLDEGRTFKEINKTFKDISER